MQAQLRDKLMSLRPWESPTCVILVGGEEAKFTLHTALLERTAFFEVHGQPEPKPKQSHNDITPAPHTSSAQDTVGKAAEFLFPSREQIEESEAEVPKTNPVIDLVEDADYTLADEFYYSRDSFNIFYRHLNDAAPSTPTDSDGCESLYKAYALARLYKVRDLQNEIIGALQAFFSQNTIPITDLIYIVNRFPMACTLYQYILAQVAYEMACDWGKFRQDNRQVVQLFSSGKEGAAVIESLFEAAMGYAKPLDSADPAKHKRSWRL